MSLSLRCKRGILVLIVALATHTFAILAFPRALMTLVLGRIEARVGTNRAYAAPRPDHTFRAIVRPSPDLLYSVCVVDLDAAGGAVEVEAVLPEPYGSVALYDEATNVVRVLRDRDFDGGRVRVLLVDSRASHRPAPGVAVVALPTRRALLLQRALVPDEASLAAVDRSRRTLVCRPVSSR